MENWNGYMSFADNTHNAHSISFLVIIPAFSRQGGIPGKYLRKLCGKPLLTYCFDNVKACGFSRSAIVVTDDEEVVLYAERNSIQAIMICRDEFQDEFSVYNYTLQMMESRGISYEYVLLLSPSVPLVRPLELEKALELIGSTEFDSVVSARKIREHTWNMMGGVFASDYAPEVFATQDEIEFTEGFVLVRRVNFLRNTITGDKVKMLVLPRDRSVAIHDQHEWWICEKLLARKKIIFVVAGNQNIGMGHVYRALSIAHELVDDEIYFLCTRDSDLAVEHITKFYYPSDIQGEHKLEEEVIMRQPDLVINDFLDTSEQYIWELKSAGCKVINFEDIGGGAIAADLVINALYDGELRDPRFRTGPEYFCLRDEFIHATRRQFREQVENVLITFGGVDEANLTARVLRILGPEALHKDFNIFVVIGPGYTNGKMLEQLIASFKSSRIQLQNSTRRISDYMAQADLAISSAGRTVYELAHMLVPTIVIAANERETTHHFARGHNGFVYHGLHSAVTDQNIYQTIKHLMEHADQRWEMRSSMGKIDFSLGMKRVVEEIKNLLRSNVHAGTGKQYQNWGTGN